MPEAAGVEPRRATSFIRPLSVVDGRSGSGRRWASIRSTSRSDVFTDAEAGELPPLLDARPASLSLKHGAGGSASFARRRDGPVQVTVSIRMQWAAAVAGVLAGVLTVLLWPASDFTWKQGTCLVSDVRSVPTCAARIAIPPAPTADGAESATVVAVSDRAWAWVDAPTRLCFNRSALGSPASCWYQPGMVMDGAQYSGGLCFSSRQPGRRETHPSLPALAASLIAVTCMLPLLVTACLSLLQSFRYPRWSPFAKVACILCSFGVVLPLALALGSLTSPQRLKVGVCRVLRAEAQLGSTSCDRLLIAFGKSQNMAAWIDASLVQPPLAADDCSGVPAPVVNSSRPCEWYIDDKLACPRLRDSLLPYASHLPGQLSLRPPPPQGSASRITVASAHDRSAVGTLLALCLAFSCCPLLLFVLRPRWEAWSAARAAQQRKRLRRRLHRRRAERLRRASS
eukprot:PLAT10033.1.p1 GENE.PLAT10033.1~~PLAT10033.1.p1  ORF type:complete len:468 (-),score=108.45 PLAT10033.1:78-1442(-)